MPILLVIDDEPAQLQLFRRVFEKSGIHVVMAETGAEGLRRLPRFGLSRMAADMEKIYDALD